MPERDDFELALARRAIEREIPLLGICRGMQMMNVARGRDAGPAPAEPLGHEHPAACRAASREPTIRCTSRPDRAPRRRPESEHTVTLSHHHQGIGRLGEDLVVTGWTDLDELPEAIEVPDHRFALGSPVAPRGGPTSRMIAALVEEAREFALARSA